MHRECRSHTTDFWFIDGFFGDRYRHHVIGAMVSANSMPVDSRSSRSTTRLMSPSHKSFGQVCVCLHKAISFASLVQLTRVNSVPIPLAMDTSGSPNSEQLGLRSDHNSKPTPWLHPDNILEHKQWLVWVNPKNA